ncbi:unnamed protein product [Amoebophrya sp. A25]|nr:unnamed protein product [Amoebophrya sp. A25]|eukprot:GSA25T00018008001.1
MGPPNATATLGGSSEPTRAAAGEQASVSAGDHTLVAGTTEQQQPSEEQDAQMNDDVAPSPSEEQDAQMNIDVVQKELEQPSLRVEDPQSSSTTSTCVFKQKEAPELPPTSVLEQKEAEVALPDSSDPGLHQNDEPVILHIPTTIENPADVSGIDAEFASELLQLQRNTFFNRDVVSQEDPDFKERIEGVKDEARPSLLHLDGRPDSRELDDDEEGTARKRPRFDTAEEPVEGHRNKACTPTTPIDRTTAQGGEDLLPVLKTPIGTPGGRETPFDSASSRRHPLGTPGGSGLRSCLKSGGKSPRPGTARNSKVGGPRPRVHFSSARRNKRGGGGSHVVKNCNIPDQIAGEETNKKAPPPASAATLALAELRGDDENLGPGGGGDKSTSNKEDLQVQGEDDDHLKDENVLGAPGGGGWLDYSFSSAAASPVEPTGSGGGGGLLHHVGRLLWSANNSANGGSAKGSSSNNNSVNSSSSAPNKGPPNTGPSSSSSSCAGSPPAVVSPHLLHLPATCSGKEAGLSSASAGNVRFGVVELPPIEEEIEAGGLVERNQRLPRSQVHPPPPPPPSQELAQ